MMKYWLQWRPLTWRGFCGSAGRCSKVLSFGDGSSGALGHADSYLVDVLEPKQVEELPSDVTKVGSGHFHSFAIVGAGELWAWGRNNEGQLGRGEKSGGIGMNSKPQRVRGLDNVEVISAAGSGVISVAVGRDGSLWAWGSSKRGQLGLGLGRTEAIYPEKIKAFEGKHITQVALGWGHAIACTAKGELYAWGCPVDKLLGIKHSAGVNVSSDPNDEEKIYVWEPQVVGCLEHHCISQVTCGLDHSLVLTGMNEVFSFGDNSYGQLGRLSSDVIGAVLFDNLDTCSLKMISAAYGHSFIITSGKSDKQHEEIGDEERGTVYSWGWNSASQLGRSEKENYSLPGKVVGLQHVSAVVGGRAHSIALTVKNGVWVWGSGQNGRLGLGTRTDSPFPTLLEDVAEMNVEEIACGFDHSLLLVT